MRLFLTNLKNFIKDVANDQEIPARDKKIILALLAYLISPFDLIPDWIPLLGALDDLVVLAIILDYFFTVLDSRLILRHYPWGMKSFAWLRGLSRALSFLVPNALKKKLWKYTGEPF
jgi:hypothetical protein